MIFYFLSLPESGRLWWTPGRLKSESCQLCQPQYIYTSLTPNPNPNPNLQQWFRCKSLAESGRLHQTLASKVVQKEVLGNFDVKSTGVHRSRWGSVKYWVNPWGWQVESLGYGYGSGPQDPGVTCDNH